MGSASGLDPDISLEAALIQVPRVAKARGLTMLQSDRLVKTIRKSLLDFSGRAR